MVTCWLLYTEQNSGACVVHTSSEWDGLLGGYLYKCDPTEFLPLLNGHFSVSKPYRAIKTLYVGSTAVEMLS